MDEETKFKATFDEKGNVILKEKSKIKSGAKSKSAGGVFELKVRKDMEAKGWIVDKWSNNVDMEEEIVVPARRVFKRFGVGMGVMTIGTGFPDFICFQKMNDFFKIIGVEVKINGTLSKEEKQKCDWLLKNNIFSEIFIASKIKEKNRVRIEYENFLSIKKRMKKNL